MLRDFPALLVICGLRDYGTATWEDGEKMYICEDCDIVRGISELSSGCPKCKSTMVPYMCDHIRPDRQGVDGERSDRTTGHDDIYLDTCHKCGAKRIDNQLGLEATPEEFIENCVKWAREVWRVLRKDGTFWLNLGDSYAGSWGAMSHDLDGKAKRSGSDLKTGAGLKPKDLCGIPWKVVFALQADGWWLRSAMPWVKRSAMPESATDRPASALEYMFLLTKNSKYYFDMDAIRQPQNKNPHYKNNNKSSLEISDRMKKVIKIDNKIKAVPSQQHPVGRNFRNTDLFYESLEAPHGMIFSGEEMVGLDVNPQAFKDAHFATFAEKLVSPCIKAGTSERGACPECQAPWQRVVEKSGGTTGKSWHDHTNDDTQGMTQDGVGSDVANGWESYKTKTIGWQPTCKCHVTYSDAKPVVTDDFIANSPVPCIVFDPFGGSGTVKNVAERLGRKSIVMDLSFEYCGMAKKRCVTDQESFEF